MTKVFVFGLDGATLDLILPWAEQGKLPNFARLFEEGAWAHLESVPSMRSPAAWSTFMTGKNPGKHGLYEFYEPIDGTYNVRFINGGMRRGKSLWKILSEHGRNVGVVNVPMTYPAEQVNGFQIAGLDAPSTSSPGFCHPPDLLEDLEGQFGTYILEPGLTGCIVQGRPDAAVRNLQEELLQKQEVTRHLMKKADWDFFMVVFRSLDSAQHCFWKYMDRRHPLHDPQEAEQFGAAIPDAYVQLDQALGAIRDELDDDTVLMIMSDHGFGRKHRANSQLNHWLASQQLLTFVGSEKGKTRGAVATRLLAALYRQVIGRTPRRLKQTLAKLLPGVRDRLQSRLVYANIDWSQTMAFSDTLFANIRINLRGREPNGIVAPGDEYERVVQTIREALISCRDSVTGKPIVDEVFRREEIYHGPFTEAAPDLLIRWKEDEVIHGIALPEELAASANAAGSLVPGEDPQIISGDHKLHGVLLMAGPGIRQGAQLSRAHLADLTPTILSIFGLPVPDDMDGKVLQEAFESPVHVDRRPGGRVAEANEPDQAEAPQYSQRDLLAIHDRLRALGYIE